MGINVYWPNLHKLSHLSQFIAPKYAVGQLKQKYSSQKHANFPILKSMEQDTVNFVISQAKLFKAENIQYQ